MSTMNYHDWFYKYHKYLTGSRNGTRGYLDTKWKTINARYEKLAETMSSLLDEQPYNIVGNYAGFQQLYDLMQTSNYTFADIDQSLIETYRTTLQNAMGNMMVNTHCVLAKYWQDDKRHVSHDKYDHYYIIEVPFAQMHFGERDEFVRQKLHAFYETESKYFMPSDRFCSDEISKILGFTIICCTNGFMSDDWYVGISEQGFRFKIGWRYSSDVELMIMKLDESRVLETTIPANDIRPTRIYSYEDLKIDPTDLIGRNCIVQISDSIVRKEVTIAPNFGYFTEGGLQIPNLQQKTTTDLEHFKSKNATLRIYVVKYLREVPGVFPAVNYYDMMSSKYVYTEGYNHVDNGDEDRIVLQDTRIDAKLPICTPPISLSRVSQDDNRHRIITDCASVPKALQSVAYGVKILGQRRNTKNPTFHGEQTLEGWYRVNVLALSRNIYDTLYSAYTKYANAAMMTTLISMDMVQYFRTTIESFLTLSNAEPNYQSIQTHPAEFDLLYGDNYDNFIKKICEPLQQAPFSTLGKISLPDYFPEMEVCVNRPISEQCFISMKYNTDEDPGCWVFDMPNIKHFHGIDNVFYVDEDLTGNELFKFMYLYTDTENPVEKNMYSMTDEQLIDFDAFAKEVDRHIGFIRYWDVSNRLMKLSEMFYHRHDETTELSILSKIMKKKLEGDIFLEYASDVNYELSNVTTDNIANYTETSTRAPFAINFLFYTLSLFYGHRNRMQAYLLHMLTNKKFYPRYSDLKLSDLHPDLKTEYINYSVISYSPTTTISPDRDISSLPDTSDLKTWAGIQFPLNPSTFVAYDPSGNIVRYPFVFNVYNSYNPFYMLTPTGIDEEYYLKFSSINSVMGTHPTTTYVDDAQIASLVSIFLAEVYDGISGLVTNYKTTWNPQSLIKSIKHTVEKRTDDIRKYVIGRGSALQFHATNAETIVDWFMNSPVESNPVYGKMVDLETLLNYAKGTLTVHEQGRDIIYTLIKTNQDVLTMIRKTYENTGFDRYAIRRLRRLYLQMKKLNQSMSLYEYEQWLNNLDVDTLTHITDYLSTNPNRLYPASAINAAISKLLDCRDVAMSRISQIQPTLDSLLDNLQGYLDTLVAYCDDVTQNWIFDFFVMNKIPFSQQINSQPAYAEIQISSNAPQVAWDIDPIADKTYAMLAQVKYEYTGVSYQITEIIPTCENAFCDGTNTTVSVAIYGADGVQIQLFNDIPVSFTKIGVSSDIRNTITRYLNAQNIPIEVQNVHESFNTDGSDVIQTHHADLHYELLCGNRFTPLDHMSEYCAPAINELQGPIDKLYLSCEQMNRLSVVDEGNKPTKTMHFRACEVFHIDPVDDVITSIGGKYFEGQTVYAVTDDGLSLFPIIITKIDHSLQRGFIEAKVDLQHTKWFETHDDSVMHKYLTTNIECTIVDDNIRNFLDEFTDYMGPAYIIPSDDTVIPEELPGDPVFVSTNQEYVYARIAWMFSNDIPNRFNTSADIRHHFVYMGDGQIVTDDNFIMINMINHNFNSYTLPELYPVLRSEPDDHSVWAEERRVFAAEASKGVTHSMECVSRINYLWHILPLAETEQRRQEIRLEIEDMQLKYQYWADYTNRMDEYLKQLECASTWYNIRAYDDALVYINNGRAHLARTFQPYIMDVAYADKLNVLLYDWEKKEWVNPTVYSIETTTNDNVSIDPVTDANTDNVLTTMKIVFNDESYRSKRLLIYFVYETSDIFDDIPMNDMQCVVRFQPVLTVYRENIADVYDPYDHIRLRKHYDENEIYTVSKLEPLEDSFGQVTGFIFTRPSRSGYFTNGSPIRFGDMKVVTTGNEYTYEDFDIYIPDPMIDVTTPQTKTSTTYAVSTIHAADHMEPGHRVTLIAVNNDDFASFDKTASSVMFQGITTDDGIVIENVAVETAEDHTYTCTIVPDASHPIIGGVYHVTVTTTVTTYDEIPDWFYLDDAATEYRLIPERVALVAKSGVTLDATTKLKLCNQYIRDTSHQVEPDNSGRDDLYVYYYDTKHDIRYPVGDVLTNSPQRRLEIDLTENTDVESIRSNYLGICRYATQKIPQDGVIDLTGYIPTPLTRDRYEFWVNGRYVSDPEQIIILSPTSFQLRNMTSLRNLDVVELIDDVAINVINRVGPVYVDFDGNTYNSYFDVLKHRANIVKESVGYMFYQDARSDMDTYLYDKIRDSHNHDYETDIMSYVQTAEVTSYNQLHNVPTINGVPLFNLSTADLGLQEIPTNRILKEFDKAWKFEGLCGITPFKHMAMYVDTIGKSQTLHVRKVEDGFDVYATGLSDEYFTLYISSSRHGVIDEETKTQQIIPMIAPGIHVIIDNRFEGMWLHSTIPATTPIKIQ